jgi:glycosyltransferase involved in cell wall biosynthesis
MAMILLRAAHHVWVSTPAWESRWRPLALGRPVEFTWIPVPSSIPRADDPVGVAAARARYASAGRMLVGHFGTYRPSVATPLRGMLLSVVETDLEVAILLMGRGSESFRAGIVAERPELAGRIHATGGLDAADLSLSLSACDLMLQPFPDGVNGRQSSLSAILAHGRPSLTNEGESTEPIWAQSGAVAFVDPIDGRAVAARVHALLADDVARERMGAAALALYRSTFEMERIIATLRAGAS